MDDRGGDKEREPLDDGEDDGGREQFAQHNAPAGERVKLEQIGIAQVGAEVMAQHLRPDEQGPEDAHEQEQPNARHEVGAAHVQADDQRRDAHDDA